MADHVYLTELLKILVRRFSFDELRMLCFELGVDDEGLPDYAKSAFAREFLRTLDQRQQLEALVRNLQRERSDIILPERERAARRRKFWQERTPPVTQPQNVWRHDFRHTVTALTSASDTLIVLGLSVTMDSQRPYGELVALDVSSGGERWRRAFKDATISGVVRLERDGSLGIGLTSGAGRTGEGALVAVGRSGQIHWRHSLDAHTVAAPAAAEGLLGAAVDDRSLLLTDAATGRKVWRRDFDTALSIAPPAIGDGVLYLPCRAPMLIAVSMEGEVCWRFSVPGALSGLWLDQRPWVTPDLVVIVARQGTVFAVDRERGSLVWESEVGPRDAELVGPIGDGRRLYVGARDGLHALQIETGRPSWMFSTPSPVVAPPAISEGMVCTVTRAGRCYGLDARTGEIRWRGVLGHEGHLSPSLVEGDAYGPYVVFANRQGMLSALRYPVSAEQHESAGRWYRAARTWDAEGNPGRAARAWEAHARSLEDGETAGGDRSAVWQSAASRYEEIGEVAKAAACRRAQARVASRPMLTLDVEHPPMTRNAWSQLRVIVANTGFGVARDLRVETIAGPFEGDVTAPQTLSAIQPGDSRFRALDVKALEHGERVPLRLRLTYRDEQGTRHEREETLTLPVADEAHAGRAGLVSVADSTYVDMEIRVDAGRSGLFDVEVTLGDGRVFAGGRLPPDILAWQPTGDAAQDGRSLFEALFGSPETRQAWDAARAADLPCRVRLRIDRNAEALHAIPWELMDDGACTLAADAHTPFSRYVPVSRPWGVKVAEPPVRVLALIANPRDLSRTYGLPALDVRLEKFLLAKSVASVDPGALQLDFMRPPVTLARLARVVNRGYHLIHVVAHSRVNARDGRTELLFEDQYGRARPVGGATFSRHLAHQSARPHMVFLAACHTGPDRTRPSLLTVGRALVGAGVPAVVAMQGAVHIGTAQALTSAFYGHLAAHGVVDRALNQARNAVLSAHLPDAEKPVLFMRLSSGRLW